MLVVVGFVPFELSKQRANALLAAPPNEFFQGACDGCRLGRFATYRQCAFNELIWVPIPTHRRDSPWHLPASECIRGLAEGSASWALPSACLHEFLAIVTHEKIFSPPTALPKALDQLSAWLESPTLVVLSESAGYWEVLARVIERAKVTGPRIHDARVAALCIHHGVQKLLTADRDFSRFSELTTRNPLASAEG